MLEDWYAELIGYKVIVMKCIVMIIAFSNPAPLTNASRLYDANYYVMNEDFRVYICIENGSTGDNPKGNVSQDQPRFTDLEPSKAGDSGDGYIWKYLFTVSVQVTL